MLMRLVYAYEDNHLDPAVQSGRPYHVRQALIERGCEIVDAPLLAQGLRAPLRPLQLYWKMRGRIWRPDRHPWSLKRQAARLLRTWQQSGADAIVLPSTLPAALLPESIPTFVVADAFFHYAADRYPAFSNLATSYRQQAEAAEKASLAKAEGFVVPTPDVAQALARYDIMPAVRVRIARWGPNFRPTPGSIDKGRMAVRLAAPRLLFVGREWQRKGFDVLAGTIRLLRERGMTLPVDVAGLRRSDVPQELLRGIEGQFNFLGSLDAGIEAENRKMREAFLGAAALMVPTRAENFGITFVEALAHGLPIFAFDIDGLKASVGDCPASFLLPPGAGPEAFAAKIADLFASPERYAQLSAQAAEHGDRYSWLDVADALLDLIAQSRQSGRMAA
jgi:glycosyltransferase involved in cell wall biosynthesis